VNMFTKRVRARMLGVLLTCATSVALDAVCKVHVATACVCGVARQGSVTRLATREMEKCQRAHTHVVGHTTPWHLCAFTSLCKESA
jgi:hypothetical protein